MRHLTCLRCRIARQPLATSCNRPWTTKVAETGRTRARQPLSSKPPAMPKTPEMAAVTNDMTTMKTPAARDMGKVLHGCGPLREGGTGPFVRGPAARRAPEGAGRPAGAQGGYWPSAWVRDGARIDLARGLCERRGCYGKGVSHRNGVRLRPAWPWRQSKSLPKTAHPGESRDPS